ncbi:hypothetical protein FOB58_005428 [Candida parapsilosis]|uniref:Uncharacterized protein n=2 Tax=Candida parapsilosis TaxID=5480 RepID=G8B4T4_CANPC|nr:uncharacterized protein CPAR2_600390 [Candida parapsilosis]KAF6043713.1 hypothetical protein FOB58_005428 [Candida parapsilosis]KAF6043791.1 hypothetical protein FOB59_004747 [Candida parapsilosis]KAF6045242.1 hypothetical protein FOB60_005210 [Candida parapsilosis]KAF6060376.1 hypothetical protein FOB61_005391 [Candida parapsilosis]CCE39626.1 hypothetical protein CPAR2_600390 [Candida parapsilosis]
MMSPNLPTNSRESTTTTIIIASTNSTGSSANLTTNSSDSTANLTTNSSESTNSTNSHHSTHSTNSTPTTNTPATSTSTSDDSESVDSEVKELIKGRESLTFGPEALTSMAKGSQQQQQKRQQQQHGGDGKASSVDLTVSSSSNMSSMSHGHGHAPPMPYHYGNYIRLTDQQGNIFILHPNGYATPVRQITGHIGGSGYTNMLTQQLYAQNSIRSFAAIPAPPPMSCNQPPSQMPPQIPPQMPTSLSSQINSHGVSANTNGGYVSSSNATMMMTSSNTANTKEPSSDVGAHSAGVTAFPIFPYPPQPGLTMTPSTTSSLTRSPYRKNFRKFRHLGSHSSRRGGGGGGGGDVGSNGRHSNLHEVQTSILTLAQFCGDLDLGTTNRFGNLDSTSIIINSSSANISSRSSFRSVLHLKPK